MKVYTYIEYQWDEITQTYTQIYAKTEEYTGPVALCGGGRGGGGGGGGGTNVNIVRYAPYVEDHHANYLARVHQARHDTIELSPFTGYVDIPADIAFFGAGFTLAHFPSLYDMFGKFMAGLDIEVLFDQIFASTVSSPVVGSLVAAESALLDDEIATTSIPRLQVGSRDINSVMSSTFVIGKALIEQTKTKLLAKFSADLKYQLISVAQGRWTAHLDWNKLVIGTYAEILKFYFSAKTDIDETNYGVKAKNRLWPFTVLDYERAALGALQGATVSKTDVAGASTASRVISGALSGAAMGAMIGSRIAQTAAIPAAGGAPAVAATTYAGPGALIGAGLGIAAALTY